MRLMDADRALAVQKAAIGGDSAALQHWHWRKHPRLASVTRHFEQFLVAAGFDRAPWLAVGFAAGIAAWFVLRGPSGWMVLVAACGVTGLMAYCIRSGEERFPFLRQAIMAMALMVAGGLLTVWAKSAIVGALPIERPVIAYLTARIIEREEQPAQERIRLVVAAREPGTDRAIKVRLNIDQKHDLQQLKTGAVIKLRARLMPPAPPMLPGGYDFARAAWFQGLAATGTVLSQVEILEPGIGGGWLASLRTRLSRHVAERMPGSAGGIASALASGDRGAISQSDDQAMRDAGLAHLLSISGLHVSAVVAGVYFMVIRLLALFPAVALRVRLPLAAAGAGAMAGVFYTLLTGSEVPTVRSCVGALLVLAALALGREPLSLRMVAVAALVVMLLWPEAVIGPSFQMSFAAVIAIVALHGCAPVRAFLAPREEGKLARLLRSLVMLLATGVVIELALMPIGLFHFHRAGVYGALVNVVAIPLTTFVSMPLIALALLLDGLGAGGPVWWLAGQSIELMLSLARWVSGQPGAVTLLPSMSRATLAAFALGGLWLALWRGRARLWGLVPVAGATIAMLFLRVPDILVSGDAQHVGITGEADGRLLVLHEGRSSFARDNLAESAGMSGDVMELSNWPGARCSRDFCALELDRAGRTWRLLVALSRERIEERALAAACERVDIVIAGRYLPRSCQPIWLKADRRLLDHSGGLSIDLSIPAVRSVADEQGQHGWWRPTDVQTGPVKRPSRQRFSHSASSLPPDERSYAPAQ